MSRTKALEYLKYLHELENKYKTNIINEDEKKIALETYKKLEDRKARENKKYHMYQN